jgi:hypothetical protein
MSRRTFLILLCIWWAGNGVSARTADAEPKQPVPQEALIRPLSERRPIEGMASQPRSQPQTALEVLERYVESNYPALQRPDEGWAWLAVLGGAALSVGCASLALIPTFADWGPAEEDESYGGGAAVGGFFQGMYLNTAMAMGLTSLVAPSVDLRAEYGALLDLNEGDREQRAALILRKIGQNARRERWIGLAGLTLATAMPIGAYYLGSALAGPNPNVEAVGYSYALGIAGGALLVLLPLLFVDSEAANIDRPFRDAGATGSDR